MEEFPESPTEFFETVVAAQWSYVVGPHGQVTAAVLHQAGYLRRWLRTSKSDYDADVAALQQRITENKPSPGTEEAVRRQIEEVERTGHELYARIDGPLAAAAQEQVQQFEAEFKNPGAFQSLRFFDVLPSGRDDYLATFAHGQVEVTISPLSPGGKIGGLLYHEIP